MMTCRTALAICPSRRERQSNCARNSLLAKAFPAISGCASPSCGPCNCACLDRAALPERFAKPAIDGRSRPRRAAGCALCRERKASLSPGAVAGRHDGPHTLPENIVDVVHRIRTDPARLSRSWFDAVIAGVDVGHYVELVGVSTLLAGLDYF